MTNSVNNLLSTVIANDYCIGCGACAALEESPLEIKMDGDGKYKAFLKSEDYSLKNNVQVEKVCPFSDKSTNETEIGKSVFKDSEIKHSKYTGYYLENFAGYVTEGAFRKNGSSGGMGNWIVTKLLENEMIDGVIHVKENKNPQSEILFEYQISKSLEEVQEGAKSKYYPIELSKVLKLVRENAGRYALVGIPCFIKSVRLLSKEDPIIRERIKYYVGLVCGHLKSTMFAKSIGWELGVSPEELTYINFRNKLPNRGSNDYGVEVAGKRNGEKIVNSAPTKSLYTTNWGQGYFKYNACEFCDDVLAETADITVGDAWLPEYQSDYLGTNVVTVRNLEILNLINKNIKLGNLTLDPLSIEKVYDTQAGGFRHRRDGLAYRLYLKDKENKWRPKKRVNPGGKIKAKRKKIYDKRSILIEESFKAYKYAVKDNNFDSFKNYMDPHSYEYRKLMRPHPVRRIVSKIKKIIK